MRKTAQKQPSIKNVFLDTSAHVATKFSYRSGNLRRLAELAEAGLAVVYDTSIDEGEICSNIRAIAEQIANALKKFQREGAALRDLDNIDTQRLFARLEAASVEKALLAAYREFQRRAAVRRVPLPADAQERVFKRYFATEAPFGTGEKKSEFPDAFIVVALEDWCRSADELMHIVTHDKGFAAAAVATGVLTPLTSLDEFLNHIVSEEHHTLAIRAQRWLSSNRTLLVDELDESFVSGGFYVEDADGDVEEVSVEEMVLSEPLLLEATSGGVIFSVRLQVTFQANISYDDPATGSYDSEEKRMVFMDRVRVRVRHEDEYRAEVTVEFPDGTDSPTSEASDDALGISDVTIDDGRDIAVSTEDEVIEVFPDDEDDEWFPDLEDEEGPTSTGDAPHDDDF